MRERLEPVDPAGTGGYVPTGEYVMTVRVTVGSMGVLGRHDTARMHQSDWWTEAGATWQRVVRDPELPTLPGAVIRCEIEGYGGERFVAELDAFGYWYLARPSRVGGQGVPPGDITRVLAVLDPGREPDAPSTTSEGAPDEGP